ncbi:hypothetical protein [Allonocardiopsis opalescens]|uniref:Uncharacterized protein n=1 Tax=Allonocardiopsis opalescens TaxID=1144618 RepID=A0A2T0Q4W6_9ACTN|nr:hypothetical protein [Allonocardiopsis opalescens]PRX98842.1 hypothetical protein CLV72_104422 [Allonocardiopsis opalescens]
MPREHIPELWAVPRSGALVRCPWCATRGLVAGDRFACTGCGRSHVDPDAEAGWWCACCGEWEGTSAHWFHGPADAAANGACGGCGRELAWSARYPRRSAAPAEHRAECPGCHRTTVLAVALSNVVRPADPVDRLFGLPLWLQTPCAGHVLWAVNRRHLDYLDAYLTARHRDIATLSLGDRLPRWMTSAKNRDAVGRALTRLHALA